MKFRYTKGFTLIELLVVIAIIGMLSSVILASLNAARGKANNSAIKEDLNNIRAQAQLSYENNNGSYNVVCIDPIVAKAIAAAQVAGGGTSACNNAAAAWAAAVQLKVQEGTSIYWCVDSTGTAAGKINALAGTACPVL